MLLIFTLSMLVFRGRVFLSRFIGVLGVICKGVESPFGDVLLFPLATESTVTSGNTKPLEVTQTLVRSIPPCWFPEQNILIPDFILWCLASTGAAQEGSGSPRVAAIHSSCKACPCQPAGNLLWKSAWYQSLWVCIAGTGSVTGPKYRIIEEKRRKAGIPVRHLT